ncbi:MAG: hypothetical protein AAF965_05865 [Pseudomonadota bacterium]
MISELEERLESFDGVDVSVLKKARCACHDMPGFFEELIRLCVDPRPAVSDGAAWILKAETDDGQTFRSTLIEPLTKALDAIPSWQAKLSICQSVGGFEMTPAQARTFYRWAEGLSEHKRPFLRAWSLHARVTIGLELNEFKTASEAALAAAEHDTAASVRARARNLREMVSARRDKL